MSINYILNSFSMMLLQISDGGESPTFKPGQTSKLVIIEGVSYLKICGLIYLPLMATVSLNSHLHVQV